MDVMKSERNKTLKIVDGFKFRFHKFLNNDTQRWCCTVKTSKYFLKFDDNNICIDSFKSVIVIVLSLKNGKENIGFVEKRLRRNLHINKK